MRSEIITQRVLTADDGMYLTNGETCGKTVVLPERADASEWWEITKEEKESMESEEQQMDESEE